MHKVILIVLDGWGLYKKYPGNAIELANTPVFDKLWKHSPHATLAASGEAVGLPPGQMGTSEVNHLTIGAGRIMFQDLVRINKSIADQSFFKNPAFVSAFEHVKKYNSTLHLKGLLSPGGVHAHQDHLFALLKAAKSYGIHKVFIHIFTDGRDTRPKSALTYVKDLEKEIQTIGLGKIASVSGRYYAMDRDHNWERTDKVFTLITKPTGTRHQSAKEILEKQYAQGISDEFIEPALVEVGPAETSAISSNDAIIFVNFRSDRPRQLVERFLKKGPKNLKIVTMTRYHPKYKVDVAFAPLDTKVCLGQLISNAGMKQLRITETEKYAHMTFFLNSKREEAFEGEDRIMLDSYSDIKTHNQRPQMRTPDIAREIVSHLHKKTYSALFANLCNADMVGHSGDIPATRIGCETVDKALGEIIDAAGKNDYTVMITADHGNAEEMIDEKTGAMLTQHSLNPVPFILVSHDYKQLTRSSGNLTDVAPTILQLLQLPKPTDMTGESFI